jgi:hypothetical protein
LLSERYPQRRRGRRWDRVSWWYSLLLIFPLLGFALMLGWSSADDDLGLSGVVTDAYTGKPVPGAIVSTVDSTATTNGDGRFSVDDITAPNLTISREDYESTQVAVTAPDERIEVELRPTFVEGTVRNKRTGEPIGNVTVTATGSAGATVSAQTDQEGHYRIDNLPPDATITVAYEGFTVTSKPIGRNVKLDFEIRPDVLSGRITDEAGQPIEGAVVSIDIASAVTGPDGTYRIAAVPESGTVTVKKAGYLDHSGDLPDSLRFDATLKAFRIRAVYVAAETAADDQRWSELIDLVDQTEINAVVLDVKDESGRIYYASQVRLAQEVGASAPGYDLQARLRELRDHKIYAIARIVVFNDPHLAAQRPELAIQDPTTGGLWTTWDGLAWVNPHRREVWDYNVDIAVEAARAGFDEIQLDYLRFPSDGLLDNADYGAEFVGESRLDAIAGFLARMQESLKPTGAFLALNVAGLALWDEGDGGIGQNLAAMAPYADVICPQVFPSHFYPGQLGLDIPNDHPYDVVLMSLQSGADLVPDAKDKFRPWLQDFSFGEGIAYGNAEVQAQIQAVNDYGAHGWMLWSPTNDYHDGALVRE